MEHKQKSLSEVEVQSIEWRGSDNENEVSRKESPQHKVKSGIMWIMDIYGHVWWGFYNSQPYGLTNLNPISWKYHTMYQPKKDKKKMFVLPHEKSKQDARVILYRSYKCPCRVLSSLRNLNRITLICPQLK